MAIRIFLYQYVIAVVILNISLISYIRSDVLPFRKDKAYLIDFLKRYLKAVYLPVSNSYTLTLFLVAYVTKFIDFCNLIYRKITKTKQKGDPHE